MQQPLPLDLHLPFGKTGRSRARRSVSVRKMQTASQHACEQLTLWGWALLQSRKAVREAARVLRKLGSVERSPFVAWSEEFRLACYTLSGLSLAEVVFDPDAVSKLGAREVAAQGPVLVRWTGGALL